MAKAAATKNKAKGKESTAIVEVPARLPMPADLKAEGTLTPGEWRVLCDANYPGVNDPDAIALAIRWSLAKGRDIMKKPAALVKVWSSQLEKEVYTVWPTIYDHRATAAGTGVYCGLDEPKWGPPIEVHFKGRVKIKKSWTDKELGLTVPEWCSITVYKMVSGTRCPFAVPVYWMETYASVGVERDGGPAMPNSMWQKRVRSQLAKCGEVASLRAAFPDELGAEATAEEMAGQTIGLMEAAAKAGGMPEANAAGEDQTYSEEWELIDGAGEIVIYWEPEEYVTAFEKVLDGCEQAEVGRLRAENDAGGIVQRLHAAGLSELVQRMNLAGGPAQGAQGGNGAAKDAEAPAEAEAAQDGAGADEKAGSEAEDDLDDLMDQADEASGISSVPDFTGIVADAPKEEWGQWVKNFRGAIVELDLPHLEHFVEIHKDPLGMLKTRGPKAYAAVMAEVGTRKTVLQAGA